MRPPRDALPLLLTLGLTLLAYLLTRGTGGEPEPEFAADRAVAAGIAAECTQAARPACEVAFPAAAGPGFCAVGLALKQAA